MAESNKWDKLNAPPLANGLLPLGAKCNSNDQCDSKICLNPAQQALAGTGGALNYQERVCISEDDNKAYNDALTVNAAVGVTLSAPFVVAAAAPASVALAASGQFGAAGLALAGAPAVQTAGAVATLSQPVIVASICAKYPPPSEECAAAIMGEYAGFSSDPAGFVGSLQESAGTIQSQANGYLNNQVNTLFGAEDLRLTNAPDMSGPSLGGTIGDDLMFTERINQAKIIIQNSSTPGTAVSQANTLIDNLVAEGVDEYSAMTYVANKLQPAYASTPDEILQLNMADKATSIDQIYQCSYTWCRHNTAALNQIAESRGFDTYFGAQRLTDLHGNPQGGHAVTVLSQNNNLHVLDPTNNISGSTTDFLDYLSSVGRGIKTFEAIKQSTINGQSAWSVVNLLK
jgi:hypothetical protein